ncbi:hypothetical protein ACFFX1_34825 [Dactylosporangium sucinum]|uniref:Uncharacterized protein n=1 Tax=Dactylosporangium sucinum TaxID=1424081 RepID=A0A917U1E6_9ACTN|nr:hypothetical protein [Dactylosporangium sucinum]GGM50657.1 hypothetical protein GCM10007977_060510 [Dactylosporangium sucinum]
MGQTRSDGSPRAVSLRPASKCARYAVRGLVVAGFAGVAWLLSGSVAHAAGASDHGLLSSVTSLLTGGGQSTRQDQQYQQYQQYQHQQDERHADRHGRGDLVTGTVLTVLSPVTQAPAQAVQALVQDQDQGLDQGPAAGRASRSTTADASSGKHASTTRPAKAGIRKTHPKRAQEPVVQAVPVRSGSGDVVTAAATGALVAGVDRTGAVAVSRAGDRLDTEDASHETPVADRTEAQGTHHVPLLPRPAPVPAPLAAGLATGGPSSGSGLNHDGGAAAMLPAAPAGAKVLTFRPDAVEDVELRLLAAEKPTVSPD